jgi:leucyl/phenylalanyl-tRNA--protein transferase
MIFQLDGTPADTPFPDPILAEREPDGLLAIGGDLSCTRLLHAYRQGIFPWYGEGQPLLWWSPDPRTLLYPEEVHVSRSLKRRLRKGGLLLRLDSAFAQVTAACAAPRRGQDGTWLLPEMRAAYAALHRAGHAHSIELWRGGRLVGGLYGVAVGRAFFGESMFSLVPDASKIVMVYLAELLARHAFAFLDCQVFNPHLARMGAIEVPRARFLEELHNATADTAPPAAWREKPVPCEQLQHAAT